MPEITDEVLARYQAIETAAEAVDESSGTDGWTALSDALKPIGPPSLVSDVELAASAGSAQSDGDYKRARRIGVMYWRKGAEELERRMEKHAAFLLRELADVEAKR